MINIQVTVPFWKQLFYPGGFLRTFTEMGMYPGIRKLFSQLTHFFQSGLLGSDIAETCQYKQPGDDASQPDAGRAESA